ncbi:histidine kinase [Maritalea sp.]
MPTLIRFLVFIGVLAGIVFGTMYALTIFVDPTPREMSERIPARELFDNK